MIDYLTSLLYTQQGFGVVVIVTCISAFAALLYDVEHREKIRVLTQKPARGKIRRMVNFILRVDVDEEVVVPSKNLLSVYATEEGLLEVMYRDTTGNVVTVEAASIQKDGD